jgi:ubiquinol-cytochrome c reductase cytochrome c1 subunit
MKKVLLAAAAALAIAAPATLNAAESVHIPAEKWSFNGVFGKFDKQQVQRGFQVYKEVCSACHSLKYVAFRNLADLGYSEAQIKTLAAEYEVDDVPNEEGEVLKRKARPSDHMPKPFANDQLARMSNGGALPPDLSLMTKARVGGPDYVYHLLLGYEEPPAGFEVMPGLSYNKYFPGHQIAMAKPVDEGVVTFADGSPNDLPAVARDVTAFLHWAAEPKLDERHSTGFRVTLYALIFAVLAFFMKRRLWAKLPH